ncbi:MAG: polysaccharide pyruvyl transferase family protein [Oscillospiraceae bacterium]
MEKHNKKVCIVTNYSSTVNYGAVLQAYALNAYINGMGYETKTLYVVNDVPSLKRKYFDLLSHFKIKKLINTIKSDIPGILARKDIKKRREFFMDFRMSVPHTNKYLSTQLDDLQDQFDVFIAGSDQIFRPNKEEKLIDYYWLKMISNGATKASYAASMGIEKLNDRQEEYARKALKSFDFISLREKSAVDYFKQLTGREDIICSVDPVFLLSKEQWRKLSVDYPISDKYIFVYLITGNKQLADSITMFARQNHYKIVTFPSMGYVKKDFEDNFGDLKIVDASPEQFISIIDNAEFIFTDSFHATVFSIILHKSFFSSSANKIAFSRIEGLLELFGIVDRVIPNSGIENGNYETKCSADWDEIDSIINDERRRSDSYLKQVLTYSHSIEKEEM